MTEAKDMYTTLKERCYEPLHVATLWSLAVPSKRILVLESTSD